MYERTKEILRKYFEKYWRSFEILKETLDTIFRNVNNISILKNSRRIFEESFEGCLRSKTMWPSNMKLTGNVY